MSDAESKSVLAINSLSVAVRKREKEGTQTWGPVISEMKLEVCEGEIVAVAGGDKYENELLVSVIMGIFPENVSCSGEIFYRGMPVDEENRKSLCGKEIGLISLDMAWPGLPMGAENQTQEDDRKPWVRGGRKRLTQKEKMRHQTIMQQRLFERYGLIIAYEPGWREEPVQGNEPIRGTEPAHVKRTMEELRRFADKGNGVLLVTQNPVFAQGISDRILRME